MAIGQASRRTVLVDGSLQFGDLRALLKVPLNAPSIVDLPTDRIGEGDLSDVLWRDPSGIDILLAPPRIEQAEMVSVRDVDKTLSLLRRVYDVIVIDTMVGLDERTLAFLYVADTIIDIVTFDSTTIHNTLTMADTFRTMGDPPTKVRYLLNRADSAGGIDERSLADAIGRVPEHRVVSDGRLVVQSNNDGVPFVLADPTAQISQDIVRVATELLAMDRMPAGPTLTWPTRGRSASSTPGRRPDGPPRIIRRLRRSPRSTSATTPARRDGRTRRSSRSPPGVDRLVERGRRRSSPATPRRRSPWRISAGAAAADPGRDRPGAAAAALATRVRRVGVIATPATVRSHAYFNAIKEENPAVEVYEHATPAFVPMVEAGQLAGPEVEAVVRDALAALLGERDANGEFIFPLPPSARSDTLVLGCTHYPLLRAVIQTVVGERVAVVDSATATASALVELLAMNGLEAPGTSRGTAADPGRAGHSAPEVRGEAVIHRQLTTGDVDAFHGLAERLFGEGFAEVGPVGLHEPAA